MFAVAFSFDPGAVLLLVAATTLYVRAVVILRRRGQPVSSSQQLAWHGGVALTALGLLGPVDHMAEELLAGHMAQHLLIADLAAPLLLIGLRAPVLFFFLPRPLLVPLARRHRLRRALSALRRSLVAIPVYAGTLYVWHIEPLFVAALRSEWLHALQHESFVAASVIVWWAALEPNRRQLRPELWKIGHIAGARFAGMFLGMALLALRSPIYGEYYGESARAWGLTPLGDQQLAGGLMLSLDVLIVLCALAFFFWRAAEADEQAGRAAAAEARELAAGSETAGGSERVSAMAAGREAIRAPDRSTLPPGAGGRLGAHRSFNPENPRRHGRWQD